MKLVMRLWVEAGVLAIAWAATMAEGQANAVVAIHGATKLRHNLNTFYTGMSGG